MHRAEKDKCRHFLSSFGILTSYYWSTRYNFCFGFIKESTRNRLDERAISLAQIVHNGIS